MNKISFFLIFLYLACFKLSSSADNDSLNYMDLTLSIFKTLEPNCYADISNTLEERKKFEIQKSYPWITDTMGKGINDIGDEIECLNSLKNTTFFMVNFYRLNLSLVLNNDRDLMSFLEIYNFTLGFCIFYQCREAFRRYVNIIAEFVNYLASKNIIRETNKSYDLVDYIESNRINRNTSENIFIVEPNKFKIGLLNFFLGILLIKFFFGLLRIILVPKGYDKYAAEKKKELTKEEINDQEEQLNLTSKQKFNEPLNDEMSTKDYNPLFDFSEKLPKCIRFIRIFDIINDIYYLSSKRNRYYNDSGLDIIVFNRAIVIFFLIFSNTFSTLISLPSEEIINSSFFSSVLNIIYRLSNNALICWAFLEGAYTTYKLLCFIQSEMFILYSEGEKQNQKLHKKLPIIFLKFLVLFIPKIITFLIIYFVFYYKVEDYFYLSNEKATFTHIIKHIFKKNIKCNSFPETFNNMFHLQIDDYTCYEFIYFYYNMLLSTLFFMIVTYLFFIIRNEYFEMAVIGINFILSFVFVNIVNDDRNVITGNDMDMNAEFYQKFKARNAVPLLHYHIKGQTYSTKIIYSFIGFYHLGFVIGYIIFNTGKPKTKIKRLMYEYKAIHIQKSDNEKNSEIIEKKNSSDLSSENDDNCVSNSSRTSSENNVTIENPEDKDPYEYYELPHYPLSHLETLTLKIDRLELKTKIILIIFGGFLLVLIDFILLFYIINTDSFEIDLDLFAKIVFMNEKNIFMIIYFFIIILMNSLPKNIALRKFMKTRLVICISRTGFFITCASYSFTYLSFLIFSLKVKLYVPTFMIISLGNFLLFFLISIFICAISELPLKIIIKKILTLNRKKESIVF